MTDVSYCEVKAALKDAFVEAFGEEMTVVSDRDMIPRTKTPLRYGLGFYIISKATLPSLCECLTSRIRSSIQSNVSPAPEYLCADVIQTGDVDADYYLDVHIA